MKNKIVTITTDFGDDFALTQLKAVLLSLNQNVHIITVSNHIEKFSILNGAFVIHNSYKLFPEGTIHIGVVDPGVGSIRQGIIIYTSDNHIFIGPNNGLFTPAVRGKIKKVFKINDTLVNAEHSNTFHGRDIFAKVAGFLTKKTEPSKIATPINNSELIDLKFFKNQVLYIDSYGNIKINNSCKDIKLGQTIDVLGLQIPFVKTFTDVAKNRLLAYKGSNNILEIANNLGSANQQLELKVGDIVKID